MRLFSILIPTYNYKISAQSEALPTYQSLDSNLTHTFTNIEIIVLKLRSIPSPFIIINQDCVNSSILNIHAFLAFTLYTVGHTVTSERSKLISLFHNGKLLFFTVISNLTPSFYWSQICLKLKSTY